MTDMPTRDENASQATWSDRAFASSLPDKWIVHPLAEDYGIDRRVEIFDGTRATGLYFNVQLKSKRKGSAERPHESVKRTTLNYWEAMSELTLVVIAHKPSKRIWYQWVHLLPFDKKPGTASRRIYAEREWDEHTAAELWDEVKAHRLARDLSRSLPVPVRVTGTSFYGEPATALKAALTRRIAPLNKFLRTFGSTEVLPRLEVAVEDTHVHVRVAGATPRRLTWDPRVARNYPLVASEIAAALALAAAGVGAEAISVRLIKLVAAESETLITSNVFLYVVALLARSDEPETVLTLMRRTVFVEGHPSDMVPLTALHAGGADASLRRSVASELRDRARRWAHPAIGLYNAANTLPDEDAREAIELYDEAARSDQGYLKRGYWWRERGTCFWSVGDSEKALESYREAIRLGDARAEAYAADVLMRTGDYRQALDVFAAAPIFENARDAQWRLSHAALTFIVEELGIEHQQRSQLDIPEFHPSGVEKFELEARSALHADALNGSAHFALSVALQRDDRNALLAAIAAAVIVNTNPQGWLHLLTEAMTSPVYDSDERFGIAFDAMVCAWKYFGPGFSQFILENEGLPEGVRESMLDFFEKAQPEELPYELRIHKEDGGYETVLVPPR